VTVMDEIRRLPPLHATLALVALGFEPLQAARLVALRRRHAPDRPARSAPPTAEKRLRFVRWLVEHGRLSDGAPIGRSTPAPADAPRTP